jgi:hypothetical protein
MESPFSVAVVVLEEAQLACSALVKVVSGALSFVQLGVTKPVFEVAIS